MICTNPTPIHTMDMNQLFDNLCATFQDTGKKKPPIAKPSQKKPAIVIDMQHDTDRQIIEKLVAQNQLLRQELAEMRGYIEGTYCTAIEFNRHVTETDAKLMELANQLDSM